MLPPPDPNRESLPYPPIVDIASVDPLEPFLLYESTTCRGLNFEVDAISDYDDDAVGVRWVANNNLARTHLLLEEDVNTIGETAGRSRFRVDLEFDFDALSDSDNPVLSFFVTDAPSWSVPDPGETEENGVIDYGAIPTGTGSVVEVRWTFGFGEGGITCPQ